MQKLTYLLILLIAFTSCKKESELEGSGLVSEGGSESSEETSDSVDNQAPISTSISINSGDASTTNTSVTLSLGATGATEMYITNTSGCSSGGSYESYSTSKAWVLGQTNTTATVYIKFKDSAGNESSCISDTIVHDNQAPTSTSISINSGDASTTNTSVTLSLGATGATEMYITNTSGCSSGGSYESYNTSKAWTISGSLGTNTVYVKFRDSAGNETSCVNDTIDYQIGTWAIQLGARTNAGGSNSLDDYCLAVDVDSSGNVYCAGKTKSAMSERNGGGGYFDLFIMKLSPTGRIVWNKQYGDITKVPRGSNSKSDICNDIKVDTSGNVYCAGVTNSSMSETNGFGFTEDAFVMKLDSSGELVWHTQLGAVTTVGGSNRWSDQCNSVDVDSSGNVYCAGWTDGSMSETNGGSDDAFVMKLDKNGKVLWHTQLGATTTVGGSNSGNDKCQGVSVDSTGNVYCAGFTNGGMSEANGGGYDAFVMKLDKNGNVLWHTQLGATTTAGGNNSGNDFCIDIDVDSSGNVYCAGKTAGDMSEINGGEDDAFVMKLDSSGNVLWHTQLGSTTTVGGSNSGSDICQAISIDSRNDIYCAGETGSSVSETGSGVDAFVMKLDSSGELVWHTQFGAITTVGGSNAGVQQGTGVAVDSSGNVYIGGNTSDSMVENNGGDRDMFVIKIDSSGNF